MSGCLFCHIAAKEKSADIVYEDNLVLAFKDIYPVAPVHILIIPKKHIVSMREVEEGDKELVGHLLLTADKIAVEAGIADSGYRIINNCGENGGQVIHHLHFHLIGGKNLGAKIA